MPSPTLPIELLLRLQKVDKTIVNTTSFLRNPIVGSGTLKEDLSPLYGLYKYKKNQCELLKQHYLEAKRVLEQANKALKVVRASEYSIKTNVEHKDYLKKTETLTAEIKRFESEVKVSAQIMSEEMIKLSNIEHQIREQKSLSEISNKNLSAEMERIKSEIDDLYGERSELVSSLDKPLYALYMDLLACCEGSAVVEVRNNICHGCYMLLPRQVSLSLLGGNSLIHCPNCSRIIY